MKRAIQEIGEKMAIAIGRNIAISKKDTIEISNHIRGKYTTDAKKALEDAIDYKIPIPYKRFTADRGHKRGMKAGRYPIKAAKEILKIIKAAEANASVKGLNTSSLIIKYAITNQGSRSHHYGRKRGLKTKSIHLEIIVEETVKKENKKKKDAAKKANTKIENKKEIATKTEAKDTVKKTEEKEAKSKETTNNKTESSTIEENKKKEKPKKPSRDEKKESKSNNEQKSESKEKAEENKK